MSRRRLGMRSGERGCTDVGVFTEIHEEELVLDGVIVPASHHVVEDAGSALQLPGLA